MIPQLLCSLVLFFASCEIGSVRVIPGFGVTVGTADGTSRTDFGLHRAGGAVDLPEADWGRARRGAESCRGLDPGSREVQVLT